MKTSLAQLAQATSSQASAILSKKHQAIFNSPKKTPQWLKALAQKRSEQLSRWTKPDTPFKVGQKQVFLPNFTITLIRTPGLTNYQAQFLVPLNFNKLDLRDYLFHAYGVRTLGVRSFLKYRPVQRVESGSLRDLPGKKRWFRPRPIKKMLVELEEPFRWPDAPAEEEMKRDFELDRFRRMRDAQESMRPGLLASDEARLRAEKMSELAEKVEEVGEAAWRGSVAPKVK